MFGLTKKAEYGLQLMVYLAKNYQKGPISLKEIAKKKKLPYRFLSQVALTLKKSALVKSKEGVGGGYYLAKSPKKIAVADILEALEGPIELVECLRSEASCPWAQMCGQKAMFEKMKGSLKKIIEAHTLADLVN
jgi:Rrf2 family protein